MRKARPLRRAAVPFGAAHVPTSPAAAGVTEEPRDKSAAAAAHLSPWAPEDHSPDVFRLQHLHVHKPAGHCNIIYS